MAYKIFADTNVFLDHLLKRAGQWEAAETLFMRAEQNHIEIFTSGISLVNIAYILEASKMPKPKIKKTLDAVLKYTRVAISPEKIFQQAIASEFSDVEDAVQYFTALHINGIEYFVSSNLRDFKKALPVLPAVSPKQMIELINKS